MVSGPRYPSALGSIPFHLCDVLDFLLELQYPEPNKLCRQHNLFLWILGMLVGERNGTDEAAMDDPPQIITVPRGILEHRD